MNTELLDETDGRVHRTIDQVAVELVDAALASVAHRALAPVEDVVVLLMPLGELATAIGQVVADHTSHEGLVATGPLVDALLDLRGTLTNSGQ